LCSIDGRSAVLVSGLVSFRTSAGRLPQPSFRPHRRQPDLSRRGPGQR
jgi:hypothetical protein